MNRILLAFFVTALLCGNLLAQFQQPPNNSPSGSMPPETQAPAPGQPAPASISNPPNAGTAPRLAPGNVIPVQLTRSVDAKKVKIGDVIVTRVTQDMRNNTGTVVVPKDTKILGHVTSVRARNKEQKESELTIAFDHAVLKNGEQIRTPMSIQAIVGLALQNRNFDNGTSSAAQPGGASTMPGGHQGQMEGPVPATSIPSSAAATPTDSSAGNQAQPRIDGNTQGVIGIANLKLSTAADATQGSLVSSEKNDVRLNDGIFLLLRVN